MKKLAALALSLVLGHTATSAQATVMAYNIDWQGSNGYSLTGMFSFDDSSSADGRIKKGELLTFMIEGFLNGTSLGSFTGPSGVANFNFNPVKEAFFTGGKSKSKNGQRWNHNGTGIGYRNGRDNQYLTLDGGNSLRDASRVDPNPGNLRATAQVPAPATLALLGLGLVGLGWSRRKKA